MQLTITEKDKKLLKFLAIFLIIFGLGFGAIRPLAEKSKELAVTLSDEKIKQQEMEQKIMAVSGLKNKKENTIAQLQENAAEFYELMGSSQIDKMLTEDLMSRGIVIQNMSISMPAEEEYTTLRSYGVNQSDFLGQTKDQADSQNQSITYNGVYTANVGLLLQGNKDALQKVIDEYMAMVPKMQVTDFTWGNTREGEETSQSLSVSLQLYMIEDQEKYVEQYLSSQPTKTTETQDGKETKDEESIEE